MSNPYDMGAIDIAWCPGCGNYGILNMVKSSLSELEIKPEELIMVSGIGQAAKIPHYLKTNFFNGLHGRALPAATGIKAANPGLTVIAESGDGDMYGEGGNHFIHTLRRNPDITNLVHNNMVYGLTKGQASPTSQPGFKTPVQVEGVSEEPFNPLAVAIALDAPFVARIFMGDKEQSKEIIKQAIKHQGYALVDIFQPCVSFNKVNTYQWFKENTYYLEESYDPADRQAAFQRALESEKIPLGIFYRHESRPTFESTLSAYREDKTPLSRRKADFNKLEELLDSKK
ncbi:MAG: thiamine pyrophosphate-dependent enzyme [Candidatus Eremiobacteraeota bacterium]|nr:thiamine pyrophosphate-dependent enzyme [Candidatus Eremiobacteraeota bacterium]